jgi:hypothetical protein
VLDAGSCVSVCLGHGVRRLMLLHVRELAQLLQDHIKVRVVCVSYAAVTARGLAEDMNQVGVDGTGLSASWLRCCRITSRCDTGRWYMVPGLDVLVFILCVMCVPTMAKGAQVSYGSCTSRSCSKITSRCESKLVSWPA